MKEYIVDFTDKKGKACRVRIFAYHVADAVKRVKEQYNVASWKGTKEVK